MGRKTGTPPPMKRLTRWIRSRSVREKVAMGVIAGFVTLILLKYFVRDQNYFFIFAQTAHAAGIFLLVYKLTISKTCAATLWVIYMMRYELQSTYMKDHDNMPLYYVLVPCVIIALIGHPRIPFSLFFTLLWALSNTIEAVSVLPQLRLIQNAKMVEPFTAHYVFALGVARFFDAAHWIIQIIETKGAHFYLVGQGHIWILIALLCEFVQTFILADFCYYYVKRTGRKTGTAPPMKELTRRIRSRTVQEKVTMGAIVSLVALVLLVFVKDHSDFFVAAQAAHAAGILVLIYKLTRTKTCSGLSLKTQELTAIYIALRLLADVITRHNVHFLLDSLTLGATLWVIYMMRFNLKSTCLQDLHNMPLRYVITETRGHFFLVGEGHIWVPVALLCEVVQTFILADCCYYYVKSAMEGQIIMRLPSFV
ncbi:LOW QUALITY PROTEIN: hypothetical protein Cgig2_029941 [Carnegiea gigantea]|uniref:Uncharacterized protein n=1 Tax=Carnegiea gigantea TaxID=171969 RepID=A0A9Q1GYN1_9CARY|nr:LOW QUALITY PROTEIN: hypothetical protein Cgig2_029941 [Carnegiea gigantea]